MREAGGEGVAFDERESEKAQPWSRSLVADPPAFPPHPHTHLTSAGHAVTLLESEPSLGGHTLTDASPGFPIDVGFQVFNLTTYPHFVAFLDALRVPSEPSDMSFSLSVDGGKLEWASHGLGALFCQASNAVSPSFLGMLKDVLRFGKHAPSVLTNPADETISFGDYLKREKYSDFFINNYVLPMCAAVWSVPSTIVLTFPARMLIRFWVNHHLLNVTSRPVWRVVTGRSAAYVAAVAQELPDVRTGAKVTAVSAASPGATTRPSVTVDGVTTQYDAVVLAVHSDTAAALVRGRGVAADTQAALDAIPYASNDVYIHTDPALMPCRRAAWASWNCIAGSGDDGCGPVCVSYFVNSLQRLPAGAPDTFVTLNPPNSPSPELTHRRLKLAHPVFGPATPAAQATIAAAQGQGGLYFTGAWMGYGFHEDGLRSAVAVATALGAPPPWAHLTRVPSPKLGWRDSLTIAAFDRFARRAITRGSLTVVLPDGRQLDYGNPADAAPTTRPGEEWHGAPPTRATLRVLDPSFFRALATRHDVGMGEAYMRGDIEADDLGALMAVAVANAPKIEASRGVFGLANWIGDKLLAAAHAARSNTRERSRTNIEAHYDAGNDMYKLFLDETMTYSSALHAPSPEDTLAAAQIRKLDALLDAAGIADGDAVLEVGCGWGSMALRALQRWPNVTWTGLTLSKQQLEEAAMRVKAAGVADRCTLLLLDYRDVGPPAGSPEGFDAIISCEMIEAVGHDHLPSYFASLGRVLKPGGKAALQAISQPDVVYEAYRHSSDFIREHIFPGGHLVSAGAMVAASKGSGLAMTDCVDVGPQYAITLRAWRAAWEARRADVLALGYPDSFWRKYRFYFAYCEAGFDARKLRNYQVVFTKNVVDDTEDVAAVASNRHPSSILALAGALIAAWLSGALALLAWTGKGAGVSTPVGAIVAAAAAIGAAASAGRASGGVPALEPVKANGSGLEPPVVGAHAHEE